MVRGCCGGEGVFKKHIFANGSYNLVCVCAQCNRHIDGNRVFWPKSLVDHIENLPLFKDESGQNSCSVKGCTNTDTELHHFAPKEYWKHDAEYWPCLYLCRFHHRMWHDVMSGSKPYMGDPVIEIKRLGL